MELKMRFEQQAQGLEWVYRLWQMPSLAAASARVRLAEPHEMTKLDLPAGLGRTEFLLLLNALPVDEIALAADGTVLSCFVQDKKGYLTTGDEAVYGAAGWPAAGPVLPPWGTVPQICRFGGDAPLPPGEVVGWLVQQPIFAAARVQVRYRGKQGLTGYTGPQDDGKVMLLTAVDEARQVMAGYYRTLGCFVLYGPPGAVCPFAQE